MPLSPVEVDNEVRARLNAFFATAVPYPEFLIRTIPDNPSDPEVEKKITELGTLAAKTLGEIERIALREKIFEQKKGLPRIPARRVYDAAVKAALVAGAKEGEDANAAKRTTRDLGKSRGHVVVKDGCYYRETATGELERFTNFAFVPTHRIVKGDKRGWIRVQVLSPYVGWDAGLGSPATRVLLREHVIPAEAWNSKRSFVAHLPSELMTMTGGNDDDVMGILEQLQREHDLEGLPLMKSTSVLGRHLMPDGTARYVTTCGTIGADGQWMDPPDLTFLSDGGCSITHRLPHKSERPVLDAPEIRELAKLAFETVYRLNDPAKIGAILGWGFATLFAPDLRGKLAGVPILNIPASQQAGKSSLMGRFFWPILMGVTGSQLMSSTPTAFGLVKDFAALASGFLCFDELKHDMGTVKLEALFRFLRKSYTGETETRGRADQSVTTWTITAPACISGEQKIDGDEALNTRCVYVELDGNWLAQHPDSRTAFESLEGLPLFAIAPLLWSWSVRADVKEILGRARAMQETVLKAIARKNIHERLKSNLTWVAFGLLCFDEVAALVGATTPEVSFDKVARAIIASAYNEDPDDLSINPDGRPKTNVDLARADYGVMVGLGLLKEGKHYVVIDTSTAKGLEHWWLDGCESERDTWRRGRGLSAAPVNVAGLRRAANEAARAGGGHVVAMGKLTAFDEGHHRCLVLDPAKFPATLHLEPLPVGELRSHGGNRREKTPAELMALWGKKDPDPGQWGGS